MEFISVLREPDLVLGALSDTPYRFEEEKERCECPVKYEYKIEKNSAKVIVYPSGKPIKYLKLRFRGDLSFVDKVYGDQLERSAPKAPLEWRSIIPHRIMGWYSIAAGGGSAVGYGVKTGADSFAFWQLDAHGVTLFLNLMSGNEGVDLKEPLVACEVVMYNGREGESTYSVHRELCRLMCDKPKISHGPMFGVNNWYWAYGDITREIVLSECDALMDMAEGAVSRPAMIIDDGWQLNRTYSGNNYIGGPWLPNDCFSDMQSVAEDIKKKGARPGIWFRPLLTLGRIPEGALLHKKSGGQILDPSHPYTKERVFADAARIRGWGYEIIKHDFTTIDITDRANLSSEAYAAAVVSENISFYDKTKTTATVIKELYQTISNATEGADVIGCNTVSHLTAGIHSVNRVGGDTSGRLFEWTRQCGVNSVMRLPQNELFYIVDPDCAAFTDRVDPSLNLDYLEMCAITGMTTLASVTPGILTPKDKKRINSIFRTAAENKLRYIIDDYDKNSSPEKFISEKTGERIEFNWERAYDGVRFSYDWYN